MTLCTVVPNLRGTTSSDVSIKLWCCKQLYLGEVDTVQDSPQFGAAHHMAYFMWGLVWKRGSSIVMCCTIIRICLMTPHSMKLNWNQIWPSHCEFTWQCYLVSKCFLWLVMWSMPLTSAGVFWPQTVILNPWKLSCKGTYTVVDLICNPIEKLTKQKAVSAILLFFWNRSAEITEND